MMPAIEVEVLSREWIGEPQHPEDYEAFSIAQLASELSEKSRTEGKPGMKCTERSLRTRISWINRAIPWFCWDGKVTHYQRWVVLKYHRQYYTTRQSSHRQVAKIASANLDQFTLDKYNHETQRTQKQTQSQSKRLYQSITPPQS